MASYVLNKIGWTTISLWEFFKSKNTGNTEYLILHPKSRIPNWSKCTLYFSKVKHTKIWYYVTVSEFNSYIYVANIDFFSEKNISLSDGIRKISKPF